MTYHPNFPPSLSITPNVGPFTRNVPKIRDGDNAFGVEAQREAISRYGIAGRIWEAAYALCAYVDPTHADHNIEFDPPFASVDFSPIGVIELGSGTGVVAASIANAIRCSDRPEGFVIATDLPDVCPLLEHNLETDPSRRSDGSRSNVLFVRPLAWGNFDHVTSIAGEFGLNDRIDHPGLLTHIICSDLVYFPELFGPLLRTLIHLTSPPCHVPSPGLPVRIVISYKIRSLPKETPFWTAFGLWFEFQPVLTRRRVRPDSTPAGESEHWVQFGAHEDTDRMFLFVAYRRPESFGWRVPEIDQELMDGVCARGTLTKKGDDTFETILFMGMGLGE